MSEASTQAAGAAATTTQDVSLLDQLLDATKPYDKTERQRNASYIKEFIEKVIAPGQIVSKEVEDNIKHWIGEIDKKLSAQLNEIMHAEAFQKLEGTWRGMKYLIDQSETGTTLKIRVLNATKKELLQDFRKANDFDQ